MKESIEILIKKVENLEKKFETLDMKNETSVKLFEGDVLELLASLKRNQDNPENEDMEDDFEDLIYKVILVLGQLDLLET